MSFGPWLALGQRGGRSVAAQHRLIVSMADGWIGVPTIANAEVDVLRSSGVQTCRLSKIGFGVDPDPLSGEKPRS